MSKAIEKLIHDLEENLAIGESFKDAKSRHRRRYWAGYDDAIGDILSAARNGAYDE